MGCLPFAADSPICVRRLRQRIVKALEDVGGRVSVLRRRQSLPIWREPSVETRPGDIRYSPQKRLRFPLMCPPYGIPYLGRGVDAVGLVGDPTASPGPRSKLMARIYAAERR